MSKEMGGKKAESISRDQAARTERDDPGRLGRDTQDAIGKILRRHYDNLVDEQLPCEIKRLWKELEHRT